MPSPGMRTWPVAMISLPTLLSILEGWQRRGPAEAVDEGVHTHDAAIDIEERAAGVAGIDEGIRLDVILVHRPGVGIGEIARPCR